MNDSADGKLIFGSPKTFKTEQGDVQVSFGTDPDKNSVALLFDKNTSFIGLDSEEAVNLGRILLNHAHAFNKHYLFHRDAMRAPIDTRKRRAFIKWVFDHPLWTHPMTIRIPPAPTASLPLEKLFEMEPGSDWETVTVAEGSYLDCVRFDYVFVNPKNETIMEDSAQNTAFRVWIEAGGWADLSQDPGIPAPPEGWTDHNRWVPVHDLNLDCGGEDAESALVELGLRLKFFYNDDGTPKDFPDDCGGYFLNDDDDPENYVSNCTDAGDGFCLLCGYAIEEEVK